ncbi:MAG: hypothetical protein AB4426_04200 [Xenococcaceae cyanobacterium]
MKINIRKYNPSLLNQPGVLYCGRGRRGKRLGLGNPFSHKPNNNAPFQVRTLQESIECYQRWLDKLITAYCQGKPHPLEAWEKAYLKRVVKLAKEINSGVVTDLMCFCVEIPNYQPNKSHKYQCHTQILALICQKLGQRQLVGKVSKTTLKRRG